jgi:hypothetical protein
MSKATASFARGVGAALLAFLVVLPGVPALAAGIHTDLFVYQDGDTVTVSGDGFAAAETVDLVTTDPGGGAVDEGQAVADDAGGFAYQFVLHATVAGLYQVDATGESSGLTASTQFDPPPNAPVNLRFSDARTGGGAVTLTWDRVTSQSVDCYWVFRSTSSMSIGAVTGNFSCPPSPAPANFLASVADPGSGATASFVDATATAGTGYFYVVAAVKSGNNQGQSAGSNQVATASLNPGTSPSSASHDFGSITVGSPSSAFHATYRNNGPAAITLRAFTITGANPGDFSLTNIIPAAGTSIGVNGSVTFDITFTPGAAGSRSASVGVNASDSAQGAGVSNSHLMPVSGSGTAAVTGTALSVASAAGTYGGTTGLSATLTQSPGGAPVGGKSVSFSLNGTSVGSAVTNGSGVATLASASLGSIGAGSYPNGVAASFAGDGSFSASSATAALTVNRAPLTVTTVSTSKTYGDPNPSFTVTYAGFVNGETPSVLGGTLSCSSTATAGSPVGSYPIACSGQTSSNYAITYAAGTLTVAKAVLTVTADDQSRQYGTANPAFTYTFSGFRGGDTASVVGGAASCATTATAATPVGTAAIACTQGSLSATNYSFAFAAGTLTITKAPLTVTAADASREYGEANPAFTGSIAGIQNGDAITATYATGATAASDAGVYAIVPSLNDPDSKLSNYSVTVVNGSLTITKAPLTVTADDKSRAYGDADPTFTAAYAGFKLSDGPGSLGGALSCATTAVAASPVGTYPISCSGLTSGNYAITFDDGTLTVGKASLTVTAHDQSRQYGDANPAFTYAVTGFRNGDTVAVVSGSATCTTPALITSGVGSYPISCDQGSLSATNYDFSFTSGTLSVTAAPLTVTAANKAKEYGDPNPTLTGTLVGVRNGDPISAVFTTSATDASDVGSYAIVADVSGTPAVLANYAITRNDALLTVSAAPLTVTTNDASKIYGQPNPSFSTSYSGFKLSDGPGDLGGSLSFSTAATNSSDVGTYAVTPAGLTSTNYDISFVAGTITVDQATLVVTADDDSREYGEPNPALTGTLNGVVNGDDITASFVTAATATSAAGTYAITPVLHDPDGRLFNYHVVSTSGTLTVTRAILTVTADDASRDYGEPNPSFTASYAGFKLSDGPSDLGGTLAFATPATAASSVGTYAVTPSGLTSGNYTIVFVAGGLTITKAPLTVTADDASREYGDANPTFTGSITGIKNADDITAGYATSATPASSVGTYDIAPSLSDPDSKLGNYTVTVVDGTLTITKAPLTVMADDASREYGDSNPSFTGAIVGIKNADDITASYATSATAASNVGTYAIVPSLNDPDLKLGNYTVTAANGSLTITKAPLSVTADDASKTYGDPNPSFTVGYSGFKLTDGPGDLGGTLSFSTPATASSSVGTYPVTPGGLTSGNYAITFVDGTLTVGKAPLTVTADDRSRQYGDANPAFTYAVSGFRNGDTLGVVSGQASCLTGATPASDVGSYAISCSQGTLNASNYDFSFVSGTLTVMRAPLTVTAGDASRQYGDSNPTFTGSIVGIKNGDNITATYSSPATASSSVGSYGIVPSLHDPDSKLGNYSVTSVNGTLTIKKAPLTVTADNKSRTYGDPNPAFTGSISGIKNGDAITASYSTTATPASTVGSYAIAPSPNDPNGKLPNYTVTVTNGTLTITKAALTVTANNATKVVGAPNPALTGSIFGIKNGDPITATYTTTAATASPVGSYPITPVLSDPSGRLPNYTVITNNGTLSVVYATTSCLGSAGHTVLQPVNADHTSVFKKGSTVPVKFRVCDANGVSQGGSQTVVALAGDGSGHRAPYVVNVTGCAACSVDEAVNSTTPDVDFRWDPTDQQWIFNLNTKNLQAGVHYWYEIDLVDGSSILFDFSTK